MWLIDCQCWHTQMIILLDLLHVPLWSMAQITVASVSARMWLLASCKRIQVASSIVAGHAQDAKMGALDNLSGTYMRVPIYYRWMSLIKESVTNTIFIIRSSENLLHTGIFLLVNHYYRSRKPQRLLSKHIKRRRRYRKRSRECRKRRRRRKQPRVQKGRGNGKRRWECWKRLQTVQEFEGEVKSIVSS